MKQIYVSQLESAETKKTPLAFAKGVSVSHRTISNLPTH